jgi:hypothetical protein
VRKVSLGELTPKPKKRPLSARERTRIERDNELRAALNEAASLPASEAVILEPKGNEKLSTLRMAMKRVLAAEPRDLNWGIRANAVVISKGHLPGRRTQR